MTTTSSLNADLFKMLKLLLSRFMKPASLSIITSSAQLLKLDLDKSQGHVEYKKIDIGFNAETSLKELTDKKKVSDKAVLEFRMECKQFLLKIVMKLLAKAPILYSLVRHLSAFDPREMTVEKLDRNKTQLKSIIRTFIEANRVSASDADDIIQQYSDFVQGNVSQVSEFSGFDLALCRVDKFFHDRLANNPSYAKLWAVVKIVMLLSHGQATVERGFSINKQVESDNLKEDTFRARRVICDHVNAVGGIFNVDVANKQLQVSAAGARQKYLAHLEDQKKQKTQEASRKRKLVSDEVDELKSKKLCLSKDIEAMRKSADDYADKAEKSRDLTYIAKSNSLRRAAKEKDVELKSVNDQLEAACLKLQNC